MNYQITINDIDYDNVDSVLSEIDFLVRGLGCRVLDGDMTTRILTSPYLNEGIVNALNRIKECDTMIHIEF